MEAEEFESDVTLAFGEKDLAPLGSGVGSDFGEKDFGKLVPKNPTSWQPERRPSSQQLASLRWPFAGPSACPSANIGT